MKQRNVAFDVLKGIAILAVVLYHFGLCPNGYLGVDIFLVISGYFTAKSLWKQEVKNLLSGGKYILNRILRLIPLLLLAEIIIIIYGFILMMPDDFENVSQSVIASNIFANNILADITTKNYWDVVNEYKPLMHTWYLGVLMQFYILFVIIDLIVYRLKEKQITSYIIVWSIISLVSLVLYFLDIPSSHKFYQIPFRIFEFGIGSIAFYLYTRRSETEIRSIKELLIVVSLFVVISLLFIPTDFISGQYKLLTVVGLSFILVYYLPRTRLINNRLWFNRLLAIIGAVSFSIFVWHQVVFALTRYSFTSNLYEPLVIVLLFIIITILTSFSYRYIESMKFDKRKIVLIVSLFCVINAGAFLIYKRAGIFYNIPELEVKVDEIQSGIWAQYCDRGYQYDREFTDTVKPRWMVIGNSFGRDFVNIILESEMRGIVDLSYSVDTKVMDHQKRLKEADVVFISNLGLNKEFVDNIRSQLSGDTRLVVVSEKNFGVNNGQVFRKRNSSDYSKSTVAMEDGYDERNEVNRKIFGNDYIDLIAIAKTPDGKVRVFSDDGRFISQDCRHLTRAGAQFYAKEIDWLEYFKK